MRRLTLIPVLLTLVACHQPALPLLSATYRTLPVTAKPTHGIANMLIIGQSNAYHLQDQNSGYAGIQSQLGNVHFYNCAVGGTDIGQWQGDNPLFQHCAQITQGVHIDAVFWMQGESDAYAPNGPSDVTAYYRDRFNAVLLNISKTWVGAPIIFGQLATTSLPGYINWDVIKEIQATTIFPGARMIRTDDIVPGPLDNDGIHFPIDGYYKLGQRIGKALCV